jgi:hypothetical protein
MNERIENLWNDFIADKDMTPDTKEALREFIEILKHLYHQMSQLQPKSIGGDGLW